MSNPPISEIIEDTLIRLKHEDPLGQKQEAIKVQTSLLHTQSIWVWASASWALDTDGNLYGRSLTLEDGVRGSWEPAPSPSDISEETYDHICSGLSIAGEPKMF
ncbi:MAG: hypothetical protein JWM00_350 [Candidatus Saccharibacteria bacterium]|nr:hypothetical protein [Candidatus Saccharibacteria bacterium]